MKKLSEMKAVELRELSDSVQKQLAIQLKKENTANQKSPEVMELIEEAKKIIGEYKQLVKKMDVEIPVKLKLEVTDTFIREMYHYQDDKFIPDFTGSVGTNQFIKSLNNKQLKLLKTGIEDAIGGACEVLNDVIETDEKKQLDKRLSQVFKKLRSSDVNVERILK